MSSAGSGSTTSVSSLYAALINDFGILKFDKNSCLKDDFGLYRGALTKGTRISQTPLSGESLV